MGKGYRLTKKRIAQAEKQRRQCPRFSKCNVTICPLDLEMHKRVYVKGLDEVCTLAKTRRLQLGICVPWKGMTRKEWGYYCREHPGEEIPYPRYRVTDV